MQLKQMKYVYPPMGLEDRKQFLPKRNVNSLSPAVDPADYFYTGNGSHWIDAAGQPYEDEISVKMELLYEPLWEKTPLPPDLRPYIGEIREAVLSGNPDRADEIIDKAQRDAGYDKLMNMDNRIVYPIGSPHVHKAFSLNVRRPETGKTVNYIRFLDMNTGKTTAHWENEKGAYETSAIAAFEGDYTAFSFTAPTGELELEMDIKLPGGPNMYGVPTMVGSSHQILREEKQYVISWKYAPERGHKGYAAILRFLPRGGVMVQTEEGIRIKGADGLLVLAKAVRFEENFEFGMEQEAVKAFAGVEATLESIQEENRRILGEKMDRSRLMMGKDEDWYLSGEELLEKCHSQQELYPMMMDKLFDMGRFYQIVDTGKIPPMWGQHNINTNVQVCAGNNTGLFDEMDVYFKYYEDKFEDFRTNAKLLFNARGLLASVHCDPDSGLFYHFSKTYPHYCWTGCLGWIYNEFWGYYLVTGDLDFLAKRVVPALKEIALFFEDYACERDEDGKAIFVPSFSPEDPTPNPGYETVTCKDIHATRINSVMDVAICREVLENLITACRTLGVEGENIPHWEKQLNDLPIYLTDEEGGLKEWAWPAIEENYNHRHVSHHYDLWPGRAVTVDKEPEVAEAIRISNRKRGQQDDSAHGIIHRAFCAIRLKDEEETLQNMSQLICHGFVRRNLATAHFPYRGQFPDLQGAMPALLLEMCVYSEPGLVELLPAMPNCLPEGTIEGIWLYTWAKLNSMRWDKTRIEASITSGKQQAIEFAVRKNGDIFMVDGEVVPVENGRAKVCLEAGQTIQIKIVRK